MRTRSSIREQRALRLEARNPAPTGARTAKKQSEKPHVISINVINGQTATE